MYILPIFLSYLYNWEFDDYVFCPPKKTESITATVAKKLNVQTQGQDARRLDDSKFFSNDSTKCTVISLNIT